MSKKYMVYNNQLWEPYETFKYSGHLEELTLEPDTYLFVANGAKGGSAPGNPFISWGATTYGILDLDHEQTFYVNVGGDGEDSNTGGERPKGGYNGGGEGGVSGDRTGPNGAGGGGATDIRLSNEPNRYDEIPLKFATDEPELRQVEFFYGKGQYIEAAGEVPYAIPYHAVKTDYKVKAKTCIEMMIQLHRRDPSDERSGVLNRKHLFGTETMETYVNPDDGKTYGRRVKQCSFKVGDSISGWVGPTLRINRTSATYQPYPYTEWYKNTIPPDRNIIVRMEPYESKVSWYEEDGTYIDCIEVDDIRVDNLDHNLVLMGLNPSDSPNVGYDYGGSIEPGNCTFYYAKIWEDGKLVRWYVPVAETSTYDGDPSHNYYVRKGGMYDLVKKKYFREWYDWDPYSTYDPDNPNNWFFGDPLPIERESYYYTKRVERNVGANSRILVAAGGGGTSVQFDTTDKVQDYNSFGGSAIGGILNGPNIDSSNNANLRASQTGGYSFGVGANAQDRQQSKTSANWSNEGQGGGGGGWYGGYAITGKTEPNLEYTAYGGTGGSSYVLTSTSAKPTGYMEGYEDIMPSLYFRDSLMLPYQAFEGASFTVYKLAQHQPMTGDKIIVPFTGTWQKMHFTPATYKIKCYGGDGGTRYNNKDASKGGYAEGILNLPEARDLFLHAGTSRYIIASEMSSSDLDTLWGGSTKKHFQASTIVSTSDFYVTATSGGGSTDVRLEQTGYIPAIITVPDGYDEVDYIQSNGTQYIELFASTNNFECVCELTDTGDSQCIFGVGINSSDSANFKRAFAIYSTYDPADPQSAFLCKDTAFSDGSQIPYNQKIKIKTENNIISWYDMNDQLLGSITATAKSAYQSNNMILFDCSNGKSGSSLQPLNQKSIAKIYYFKQLNSSTGETIKYLVPFRSQTDDTILGLYDLVNKKQYVKKTGDPFTYGQIVPKTQYAGTENNTPNSRKSRFIVAGGGGGQGSPIGLGGDGGGVQGELCKGTSTYGTNNGPGRENGGGGFEFGTSTGSVYINNIKTYGGSGGYGWYGGYATKKKTYTTDTDMSSDDVNKGGSGGSSYVFSEETDQYKPSDYRVPTDFWMTDAKNILGGNPVRGMTRIEIEVVGTSEKVISVIAGDSEGYKTYDSETNAWMLILDLDKLTPEAFVEYGVALESIKSDSGLSFPYRMYVCDSYNTGFDTIYTHVVPSTQHVTFSEDANIAGVKGYYIDEDFCDTTANVTYTLATSSGKTKINSDISLDLMGVPKQDSIMYMLQYSIKPKSDTEYEYNPPQKTIEEIALYSTASKSSVPIESKPLPSDYAADGNPITSVDSSSSCEYKRCIYNLSLLNDYKMRLIKYDLSTNESSIVRDNITRVYVAGVKAMGGSLLIKDDVAYISNVSFNPTTGGGKIVLIVPFDESISPAWYKADTAAPDSKATAYGDMYWYDDDRLICATTTGFILFNVNTKEWEIVEDPIHPDDMPCTGFVVGDYSVFRFPNDADDIHGYLYNRETLEFIANSGITMVAGKKKGIYYHGNFYIIQKGYLYIYKDMPNNHPTLIAEVAIPNNTLNPKTVHCSKGCVYITFVNSDKLYGYDINVNKWYEITMPFKTYSSTANSDWIRPTSFGGYFFITEKMTFTTNIKMTEKYRVGENGGYIHIRTNDEYPSVMNYDERFITVDHDGLHIHPGYINKPLINVIDAENHIKSTGDYVEGEYRTFLGHKFTIPDGG